VKTTNREKIQSIAEKREVRCLLHFTQFNNLLGIVEYGLLSRKTLVERGYMFYPSGPWRLDGCEEAVSVSISRVNEPVFEAKRHKNGRTDWVILALRSAILWTHDCRFSWRNAAKKEITGRRGYRGGPWAFSEMFAGSDEDRKSLPMCYPTDIEAEVQVLEPIAPVCILGVVVYRPELVEPVRTILAPLPGEERPVLVDTF
jgi:ssDNA thymidine ADP-ribosyltransferase, DarT